MNSNIYSFLLATLAVTSAFGDTIAADGGGERRLRNQNLLLTGVEVCNGSYLDGICLTLDTRITGLFQLQVNIRSVIGWERIPV